MGMQAGSFDVAALTPVEWHGGVLVKRDDLFEVAGIRGGKVRTCFVLAVRALEKGRKTLVTAGARQSPQAVIVARVAAFLGLSARCHMPQGAYTDMMRLAEAAGAEIMQHKAGYTSVISARAREDAEATASFLIPFGMECKEAVRQTALQTRNLPFDQINRVVIPIGSGMSACGVLTGLREQNRDIGIIGVIVGADPRRRLDNYAPWGWRRQLNLVDADAEYEDSIEDSIGTLKLDGHYEAKCKPYLQPGDLFWNVGIRPTV